MGQDILSAIAKYAIYKAEKKTVPLIEKWKRIERQLSIVAGQFNDSREIEAALVRTGRSTDNYVEHALAAKKLFELWTAYCRELMSQTDFGGRLIKFFFLHATKGWDAEVQAYSGQLLSMIERGEFWMPPLLFLQVKQSLSLCRVGILEPIVSIVEQKRTHRNRNPFNGGRPNDIGLQELLSKAESAGMSASELAAHLVSHGLDGKPTGGRSTRVRREAKRLSTAKRRLEASPASAVPVGTKPRKST